MTNCLETSIIKSENQQDQSLYFIALVPGEGLMARVKLLKEEMRDRFGAAHALKSPAHITLQMPFRRNLARETNIIQTIQRVAANQSQFKVTLQGFDCFPPRVIFVKVMNHKPILKLHEKLSFQLKEHLDFTTKELSSKVHPHMTIATRDLSEEAFKKAWPEFQNREFRASFQINKLSLLKHNGRYWEIYKDFSFEG
ncbi:MAG: 2'-5' RNA ligase family protein [Flavobacteriaceae bacterium]